MKSLALLGVFIALAASQPTNDDKTLIGKLTTKQHGVEGDVYAIDEKHIVIKNFKYDGAGPDAFFWVGTNDAPGDEGTILPYPFKDQFYKYNDDTAPVLRGSFDGTKDIDLTLPEDLNVSDLKWISVWCRQFSVNFGDLIVPADFTLGDKKVTTTTTEKTETSSIPDIRPPLVEPDNTLDDDHHDKDHDVKAEPEPDQDAAHPRRGAASQTAASVVTLLVSYLVAKLML